MIFRNIHISKLNSARKITAGMVLLTMLVCGLFCVLGGSAGNAAVRAEGVYKPLRIEISFECLKNQKLSNGNYTIRILAEDESYPLPDSDRIYLNDGKGSFSFTITEPGSYTYRVYQEKGDDNSIVYDDTVYEIHLNVMNKEYPEGTGPEDGLIELIYYMSVNYEGTDKKPGLIEFENEPKVEGTSENTGTTEDTEDTETTGGTTEDNENTGENDDGGKKVQTGDRTNIGLHITIMSLSIAAVIILIFLKKNAERKREEEDEE